jgi:hypothetical protein
VPDGQGWALEPKWDGFRRLAHVEKDGIRLFTRRGRGHHKRFQRVNEDLATSRTGRSSMASLCASSASTVGACGADPTGSPASWRATGRTAHRTA